jgi:hypothetical protein
MICSGGSCVHSPTDCPGPWLVCDGFESGSIGSQWFVVNTGGGGGTIIVDGTHPHRGASALHIAFPGGGSGYVQIYVNTTNGFPINTGYARVWFAISAITTGVELIDFQSTAGGSGGIGQFGFSYPGGTFFDGAADIPSPWDLTSATTMPYGTPAPYTCLELGIDATYDAIYPNGAMWVWKDVSSQGSYLSDLQSMTAQLQSLRGANIGIQFTPPAPAFDLFIDDIAIDSSYIPCDQ